MSVETAKNGEKLELISFEIAGQGFCIDTQSVREIRGWTPPTLMPNAPPYVLGVINLRGVVMPVLDLRARLGFGDTSATSRHVYVVVQQDDRVVGLMVDAVQETFSVDPEMLHAPPRMDYGDAPPLVDAILTLEGRMLSRLVLGSLLPEPAEAPLQAALVAA
ncbi:MAG: purine-binding chemotaxis protein CheW [Phenylobacterium sp.]|uniref:chemotaxis protein CheW n=1 Tax=Phenylobacterium sp. TaxID=1871053 RepID=UPI00120C81E1|nr:chemotaxis protein CheW [Phenylobacterium sp.]TAL34129.1 MAG: purine-binding chemotaxis protein CheW [Phenylobacterium sp.]